MSFRRLLVLAVVATMVLPAVAAQDGAAPTGVRLEGDPPHQLAPDTEEERSFTVVYEYLAGFASNQSTTVTITVQDKPDWLTVSTPKVVEMPVHPERQESRREIDIDFNMAHGAFPEAFRDRVVSLHVHAESNGQMGSAENTFNFHVESAFIPGLRVDTPTTHITIEPDDVVTHPVEVTNLANARVRPTFHVLDAPEMVRVHVAQQNTIIGSDRLHGEDTTSTGNLVIRDMGGDWIQQRLDIRIAYTPPISDGADGGTTEATFVLIRGSSGLGSVAAISIVAASLGAVALYVLRFEPDG